MGNRKTHRTSRGVCPADREANLARLKRIEGQVRGIAQMVEHDRYCVDVMTQIAAVQQALRGVGREVLRHHLNHCMAEAAGKGEKVLDAVSDELIDLLYKNAR